MELTGIDRVKSLHRSDTLPRDWDRNKAYTLSFLNDAE